MAFKAVGVGIQNDLMQKSMLDEYKRIIFKDESERNR